MPERMSAAAAGQGAAAQIADPVFSSSAAVGAPVSGATPGIPAVATAAAAPGPGLSTKGLLAAAASFVIWGALPLYLKPIHELPSLQIIAHRIAWACVLVLVWLAVCGDLGGLRKLFSNRTILGRLVLSAVLVTVNWIAYVWAVGHG